MGRVRERVPGELPAGRPTATPARPRRLTARAGAPLACLLALAGCSASAGPSRSSTVAAPTAAAAPAAPAAPGAGPAPPTRLSLVRPVDQDRLDATRQMVEVPLRNDTPVPLSVRSVQLLDPHFATRPAMPTDQTLAPGERIDFVLPYGDALCPAAPGAGRLLLTETAVGGPVGSTQLALPEPQPILARIHDAACKKASITAAFTLDLHASGPARLVDGAPELPVTLTAARRTPQQVLHITGVQGSVLFGVTPADPAATPLLSLPPDRQRADAALVVRVLRCDPHGQTATKIYAWTLRAALGSDPPTVVALDVPDSLQPPLLHAQELCPVLHF